MHSDYSKDDKNVNDPRLVARENFFEHLHLSIFETINYAQSIQQVVEATGHDIEADHPDYQQLLRDYEITRNLSPIAGSQLTALCNKTDVLLKKGKQAYANSAQLCAAAISALNHWRILSDIPEDLRSNDKVTKTLIEKFNHFAETWELILEDLTANN